MKIKDIFGHLKTITTHKWLVFKLAIKAGIPIRGLLHDLSKYSPTEFIESAKFYQNGKRSPISKAKEVNGYSVAWLHHKGRNKHHLEYWFDDYEKEPPIIPFKYCAEMICDKIAAGMVYQGKNFTKEFELEYWKKEEKDMIYTNQKVKEFITEVFTEVSKYGVNETISNKNLKRIYDKNCNMRKVKGD